MILTTTNDTSSLSMTVLSMFVISPDEERRRAIAKALSGPQATVARELESYPEMDELVNVSEEGCDALVIDLDPDPERALDVIENFCSKNSSITVMVYSGQSDRELLVRCMRAGAREFLTEPLLASSVSEALVRVSVRRDELWRLKKTSGKLLVFVGAKGGAGVTTVASNFALSLAKEGGGKVALLDLDLHLGDAGLALGVTSKFSTSDALENTSRLDADFLSALLTQHSPELSVLAGPDAIASGHVTVASVEKLLRIAREAFTYVVVDAGSHAADICETLFEAATTVYLVTQVGIPELRNANRLVSRYFKGADSSKLEIVLNRFVPRSLEIDEASVAKALTKPVKWKVPNDFPAARRAQNTGVPIVSADSAISREICGMASAASGHALKQEKKKKFGLFR